MKKKNMMLLASIILIAFVLLFTMLIKFYAKLNSISMLRNTSGEYQTSLKGKKILFLGDSLTSLEKIPYEDAIKKPTEANSKSHFKYIDWIRELTGAECYNFGYSGSSIANITNPKDPDVSSFVARHKYIIKKYSDPKSFDFIVLFGGVNDYMQCVPISNYDNPDPYSFYGALNSVVLALQETYPSAKIILMNPLVSHGEGANFDFTINKVNHYLKDYRKAIADVASTKGAILFNTEQLSGLNPSNAAISKNFYLNKQDGVHPNPEGHKRIAIPLINLLEDLVY